MPSRLMVELLDEMREAMEDMDRARIFSAAEAIAWYIEDQERAGIAAFAGEDQ